MNEPVPSAAGPAPPVEIAPGAWRLTARNPSAWTAGGTNTYILGGFCLLIVDPGPDDARHLAAILAAVANRPVAAIVVTHSHLDHSALAPRLGRFTSAPVLAFGNSRAGLKMRPGGLDGGTGVDLDFAPDGLLADGDVLEAWGLRVIHTPGHMGNHICLDRGDLCVTGDQAMGWSTSIVSPPEGDMGDYMSSLGRLIALGPRVLLPGHGDPVPGGLERLRGLLMHRRLREAEVIAELSLSPASAHQIARRIYVGLPDALLKAATSNVLAHLLHLEEQGLAEGSRPLTSEATFKRRQPLDSAFPPR